LIALRTRREQQQQRKVDRLIIDGIEIDRLLEFRQYGERLHHHVESCMRDGNTATQAGGSERLAFHQLGKESLMRRLEPRGGVLRQRAQQALLVRCAQLDHGVVGEGLELQRIAGGFSANNYLGDIQKLAAQVNLAKGYFDSSGFAESARIASGAFAALRGKGSVAGVTGEQ